LLDSGGGPQNSPSAQTTAALIPPPSALLGPAKTGQADANTEFKYQQGHAVACPCFFCIGDLVFGCLAFLSTPFCMRRGAEVQADQG
ncbi:MAG: hypothetical protein ACREXG_06950, partial [Polaromonas sp.]